MLSEIHETKGVNYLMRVSVAIATYNYGKYLSQAIMSALDQTYPPYEVVVVDDGSTDNTYEVATTFGSKIKYILSGHIGQPGAKNLAARNCDGDLIAFLDADDIWLPDKLKLQIECFHDPEIALVGSRRQYMDPEGNIFSGRVDRTKMHEGVVSREIAYYNFMPFSSVVIRREVFEKIGGFDERFPVVIDYELWTRVAQEWKFAYVDKPLFMYRTGHANISANWRRRFLVTRRIQRNLFKNNNQGRYRFSEKYYPMISARPFLSLGRIFWERGDVGKARRRIQLSLRSWPWNLSGWLLLFRVSLPIPIEKLLKKLKHLMRPEI